MIHKITKITMNIVLGRVEQKKMNGGAGRKRERKRERGRKRRRERGC